MPTKTPSCYNNSWSQINLGYHYNNETKDEDTCIKRRIKHNSVSNKVYISSNYSIFFLIYW